MASELIVDGDTIYIDSGSTCTMILQYIVEKKITIYTTNADIFSVKENIVADIYVLGGRYNPVTSSMTGPFTEDLLKNLYFNKSFLGANGIDEKLGVTTPTIEEATKKKMVKAHSIKFILYATVLSFTNYLM